MHILKIYLIDDDPRAADKVRKILAGRDGVFLIGSTTNPLKGVKEVVRYRPDVLLLDLEMQPITGWEVMEKIDSAIRVIIITVEKDKGMDALHKGAFYFLDKTYGQAELHAAIDRVWEAETSGGYPPFPTKADHIWVSSGGSRYPVQFFVPDIEAVAADGNDCKLYHTDGVTIVDQNMTEMQKILPTAKFMRISRQHIIALNRFHRRLPHGEIELIRVMNQEIRRLKVGGTYEKRFYAYLEDNFPKK